MKGICNTIARSKTFIVLAFVAITALAGASSVFASTSGNATIFNQVSVEYQSGSNTQTAKADYSLKVSTLATAPTVNVDTTTQVTTAGGTVVYTYTVISNANGVDTYVLTDPVSSTNSNITDPSNTLSTTSIELWGGIILSADAGTITLPGGSLQGLSDNDTVELVVGGAPHRYTVTITQAGSAATASAEEVYAVVALAPISGAPAITSGNVGAGLQVGEYTTFTLEQTAGTPSAAGTDGSHTTNLTITTTATDGSDVVVSYTTSSTDSNEVVTTVSSPKLNISKTADKTSAKPGETITYTITITNAHATAAANNVVVTDPTPDYTVYVAGTTTLNGSPIADVAGESALQTGLSAGTINAGETFTVVYQVTVE